MSKSDKPTMTSPMANSNRAAMHNNNSNSEGPQTSPSQNATPKAKRIINKIPLDFNKLKQAGLGRSIAEALCAQKFSEKSTVIASDKTKTNATISHDSPVPVATQLPEAVAVTTSETQKQNQKAPRTYTRTSIASNYISKIKTNADPQIKELLKAKILSKATLKMQQQLLEQEELAVQKQQEQVEQQQQQEQVEQQQQQQQLQRQKQKPQQSASTRKQNSAQTLATSPAATRSPVAKAPATFTVPIPKANVSSTQPPPLLALKPPLLINLVNQLPAARARCMPSKQPAKRKPPTHSTSNNANENPMVPLIVLENKVLAPNEKIDLNELRLQNKAATPEQPKKLLLNVDKLKESRKNLSETTKEIHDKAEGAGLLPKLQPIRLTAQYNQPKTVSPQKIRNLGLGSSPPAATSSSPGKVFSAVDFIAQIAAANPMSEEESFMVLSAEELTMTASFNLMSTAKTKKVENKPPTDLAIGKIVKMDDMNILNATLDVMADGSTTNVLCISPNTVQVQDGNVGGLATEALQVPLVNITKPTTSTACNPKTLIAGPVKLTDKLTTRAPNPKHKLESSTVATTAAASKRVPHRSKKGKVNLVQRTKKPTVQPANVTNQVKSIEAEETGVPMEFEEIILGDDQVVPNKLVETAVSIQPDKIVLGVKANEAAKNDQVELSSAIESVIPKELDGDKVNAAAKNDQVQPFKAGESVISIQPEKIVLAGKANETVKNDQLLSTSAAETVVPMELEDDQPKAATKNDQGKFVKAGESVVSIQSDKIVLANKAVIHSPVEVKDKAQPEEENTIQKQDNISTDNTRVQQPVEDVDKNVILDATKAAVNGTNYMEKPKKLSMSKNKRDLTQLFHPPKMPKYQPKKYRNNNTIKEKDISEVAEATSSTAISLKDAVEQQPLPIQGAAELPFRIKVTTTTESSSASQLGIKSLLAHLEASKTPAEVATPGEQAENDAEPHKTISVRAAVSQQSDNNTLIGAVPQQSDMDKVIAAVSQQSDMDTVIVDVVSQQSDTDKVLAALPQQSDKNTLIAAVPELPDKDIVTAAVPQQSDKSTVIPAMSDDVKPLRKRLVKTKPALGKRPSHSPLVGKRSSLSTKQVVEDANQENIEKLFENSNCRKSATSDDDAGDFHGFEDAVCQFVAKKASKTQKRKIKISETYISDDATPDEDEAVPQAPLIEAGAQLIDRTNDLEAAKTQVMQRPMEDQVAEAEPLAQTPTIIKSKRGRPPGSGTKRLASSINKPSEELPPKRQRKQIRTLTPPETPVPKKRGRKPKNAAATNTTSDEPATEITEAKRKGRKRVSSPTRSDTAGETAEKEAENANEDADDDGMPLFVSHTPKGRFGQMKTGGSTGQTEVGGFNRRLLLIRKREQLDTDEELRDGVFNEGSGPYKCGLCLMRSSKANWMKHLSQHYGIGWLADQPPPLLTRLSVISMMTSYLRTSGSISHFTCRLCERKLSSSLGMVIHLENCGLKQERLECEYCKRHYTKLSLVAHLRTCTARLDEVAGAESSEPAEQLYSNTGRAKRRSTIKAETKLKKIGGNSDFDPDSSDYDEKQDVESSDEYESEGVDSNEDAIQTDEDERLSSETPSRSIKLRTSAGRRVAANGAELPKQLYGRYRDPQAVAAQRWKDFINLNYTTDMLYEKLLPAYRRLSIAEANKCLPPADSKSMYIAFDKNKDWTQLARLQSFNTQSEHFIYLGAPIKQCAWVPLPSATGKTQYLLCSLRPKLHAYTRQFSVKQDPAMLLLLKCTKAEQLSGRPWALETCLHYGIRIPHGPVHHFALLPSGGFNAEANRLGLLAIGGAESVIRIYALPVELSERAGDSNQQSVIELQPLMLLTLDMDKSMLDHCVKICWSESAGHNFIAAGYASGHIAFWDIGDEQSLNCIVRDDTKNFVALHWFYLGGRNIRFMELHYGTQGPRWLAAASFAQRLVIYDISNWAQPMLLTHSRLSLSSLCWPSIWETVVIGYSNVFSNPFPRVISVNPTGIYFSSKTIDCVLNSARSLHYSPQQNVQVIGTDNGDVVFLNTRELNMEAMIEKSVSTYRVVSTIEAHCLSGENRPRDQIVSTVEFLKNYGLIFQPLTKIPKEKKPSYLTKQRKPRNEFLSLLSNTSVHCNTNAGAPSWVAVGAEHGMLRIINFKRDKYF